MIQFNIPEKHIPKFERFIQSSLEFKQNFITSLSSFQGNLDYELVLEFLENNLNDNESLIKETLEIYKDLTNAKNSMDISINEFIDILRKAFGETESDILKPTDEVMQIFKELIFQDNVFNTKMRLGKISTEYPNIFIDADIFQDLRTVFNDSNEIIGSVITHNLKIVSRENKKVCEYYISLNERELENLIDTIEKAKQQAKLLKAKLSSGKIISL